MIWAYQDDKHLIYPSRKLNEYCSGILFPGWAKFYSKASFYSDKVVGFFSLSISEMHSNWILVLQEEAWAAGGSGILLRTTNGGKSWTRDKAADNIAANLYSVKWV